MYNLNNFIIMDKIKVYSSSSSSFPKGSFENPYTRKEYDDIINSDKDWPGGYVSGLGYVAGDTIITGSWLSDDSWLDSWEDSSYSDPWADSGSGSNSGSTGTSGGTGGGGGSHGGNIPNGTIINGGNQQQGGGTGGYSVQRAVDYLVTHAYPSYNSKCGFCARAVRLSLEAGGLSMVGHPGSAYEYKDFLPKIGFYAVSEVSYVPRKGDIVVIDRIDGHPNGHIAMYSGSQWISDFVQRDMWGGSAFRNSKAAHVIFRK